MQFVQNEMFQKFSHYTKRVWNFMGFSLYFFFLKSSDRGFTLRYVLATFKTLQRLCDLCLSVSLFLPVALSLFSLCLSLSLVFPLLSQKSSRTQRYEKWVCFNAHFNYTFEEHKQTLPSALPLRSVTAPSLWSSCLHHVHKAIKTEELFASFALMERELFGFMLREDKLWPCVL